MEVVYLRSQIVFLIRIDDHINMLHAKFQPFLSQFLGPNAARTKFGVTKCKIDPIFRLWPPKKAIAPKRIMRGGLFRP